jgi:hypothetical protein
MRFFASDFSGMGSIQARLFEFGFEFNVRDFWLTLRYCYSEESILPILVGMESCDSPHRL